MASWRNERVLMWTQKQLYGEMSKLSAPIRTAQRHQRIGLRYHLIISSRQAASNFINSK